MLHMGSADGARVSNALRAGDGGAGTLPGGVAAGLEAVLSSVPPPESSPGTVAQPANSSEGLRSQLVRIRRARTFLALRAVHLRVYYFCTLVFHFATSKVTA